MLQTVLHNIKQGTTFYGLECSKSQDQSNYLVSQLKRKGSVLDIISHSNYSTKETLFKKLPKHANIHLVLNNDKVLTKLLLGQFKTEQELVYKAFPNIEVDAFYYQVLQQAEHSVVSICRKSYVDGLIDDLMGIQCYVTHLSLSGLTAVALKPYINEASIQISNACLEFDGHQLQTIKILNPINHYTYEINGLHITSDHLLATAAVLVAESGLDITANNFETSIWKARFFQGRFSKVFMKTAGLSLLVMLLINFLCFNHYFNKVNDLEGLSQMNQTAKAQLLSLNEIIDRKESLVTDLLKSSNSRSSFYVNDLVQSLPHSMVLTACNYQPILKRIKPNKPIDQAFRIIEVRGETNSNTDYSDWISALEAMSWVQRVSPLQYSDQVNSKTTFSIKIEIKHD